MDLEKTMQFILEHEARLAARTDMIAELVKGLAATANKHDELIAKHDEQIGRLETSVAAVTDLVGCLAQAEIRLVERMNHYSEETDRRFRELAESHAHSDRRLDALIDVVDKLTRHNGGTPKP